MWKVRKVLLYNHFIARPEFHFKRANIYNSYFLSLILTYDSFSKENPDEHLSKL